MLLLLVSYLLCGTIRGRLPGEKVERNFATSNNNLIWNVLFKLQYPYSLTVEDITNKCPVFGKDKCPYKDLIVELNGITENCPAFKDGCPFKDLKTRESTWREWLRCVTQLTQRVVLLSWSSIRGYLRFPRRLRRLTSPGHSLRIHVHSLMMLGANPSCQSTTKVPMSEGRMHESRVSVFRMCGERCVWFNDFEYSFTLFGLLIFLVLGFSNVFDLFY